MSKDRSGFILAGAIVLAVVGLAHSVARADDPEAWQISGTVYPNHNQGPPILLWLNSEDGPTIRTFESKDECEKVLNTDPGAQAIFDHVTKEVARIDAVFIDIHCVKVPAQKPPKPPGEDL